MLLGRLGHRPCIDFSQDPNHLLFRNSCVLYRLLLHGERHHPKNQLGRKSPGRSEVCALSVSGHTHGGQIAPFGWVLWRPPGSGRFVAGEYSTRFGRLYITRGIGTSLIPMRIGARPEVLFVTIS